jgi:hypothetical protein
MLNTTICLNHILSVKTTGAGACNALMYSSCGSLRPPILSFNLLRYPPLTISVRFAVLHLLCFDATPLLFCTPLLNVQVAGQPANKRPTARQQQPVQPPPPQQPANVQQLAQQQQQQPPTLEHIKPLLQQQQPHKDITAALKFWSKAAGSTKLADMLAKLDALLAALGAAKPGMAEQRLRYIERVLKMDAVQQLLAGHPALLQQLPAMIDRVAAEKKRFGRLVRVPDDQAAAAAAAAAAARGGVAAGGEEDEEEDAEPAAAANRAAAAAGDGEDQEMLNIDDDQQDAEEGEAATTAAATAAAAAASGEDQKMLNAEGDQQDNDEDEAARAAAAAAAAQGAVAAEGGHMLMHTDAAGAAADEAALAAACDGDGGLMMDAGIGGDDVAGADEEADAGGSQEATGEDAAAAAAVQAAAAPAAAAAVDLALAAADTAKAAAAAATAVEASLVALMEQLKPPCGDASKRTRDVYYARYDYLDSLLESVPDVSTAGSGSVEQLQALQQVLAWLLQLPAGQVRESVLDVVQHDGWLQQLLLCLEVEAKEATAGCVALQQQPEAAAVAAADGDGTGGSMAGLCQLLLQLLAECCKHAVDADANEDAEGVDMQPDNGGPRSSSSSSVLQQLAGDLLAGTAALLLHWPRDELEQQRLKARMWRSCLQYNLQRCRDGVVGVEGVVAHVQQRAKKVLACVPKE